MTTGQRIAAKRRELALSQEALGAELGVSRQTIYKWERDASLPEIDKLIALSRRFGVTVGWLLGVEEEAPAPEALTERQLQQVEELTARYLAAQPRRGPSRALLAAGGALGLALVILAAVFCQRVLRLESQQTKLRSEIAQTTAEQIEDLQDRVQDILRQQRDLLAADGSLLSDSGAEVASVAFAPEGSTLTVSAWAVPKTWREGMTAEFLLTSEGESTAVPGVLEEGKRFSAPGLTAPLTDDIHLSVAFTLPDGSGETETLARWPGLLTASQPDYWPVDILCRPTVRGGVLDMKDCFLRVAWRDAPGSEYFDPIEITEMQVGIFQNHRLITWADPDAGIPDGVAGKFQRQDGYQSAYEQGRRTLRLPDFRIAWQEGDVLSLAVRVRDQHGREFFLHSASSQEAGAPWSYTLAVSSGGACLQGLWEDDPLMARLPDGWDFTPVEQVPGT